MPQKSKIVLPSGEEPRGEELTERGQERLQEESAYQPVIVKRTDEVRRHPDDILSTAVEEGLEQLHRATVSLLLSAVPAGLILCSTAMAVGVVTRFAAAGASPLATRVGPAVALFVGAPLAAGQAIRFLCVALAGNMVGGSVFVAALNYAHIRRTQLVEGDRRSRL